MSYYVRETATNYEVVEKDTEMVVHTPKREKDARDICRSLNLGSGFNGFTPSFFTIKFSGKC